VIRFSIRRPVAVTMVYAGLALLGVVSWLRLPVELLPATELPRLRVTSSWRGSSPEQTEAFLTSPIEAAVQQVRGVEKVESVSEERNGAGIATVDVRFARGTDMDFARLDLSERLAALEEQLPRGAMHPQVQPYVPPEFEKQRRPFLLYTITGPYTGEALRRHVDDELAPDLRRVAGVADVRAWGGRDRVLEVELDEAKILALGLDPEEVRARVAAMEIVHEAGAVRQGGMVYTVAIRERPATVDEVRRMPLLTGRGRMVRLRDVAEVRDGYDDPAQLYRIDGQPAVSFQVFREAGTNVVSVADRVKARLRETRGRLPAGARLVLDEDESRAVRTQLTDLRWRALSSALVVFVVLFGFLRSFRSAMIVFGSIAFAVLVTLNLVYFGGLTLNVLTLMGLAMGFGVVIDNAVVVLENIYRRARPGEDPAAAAERGAKEVVLAVLAATATNVIVFVPFVYLQGEARLFYVPLAIVVGLTNLASLVAAFSFTPALASRLLGRCWPAPAGSSSSTSPGGRSGGRGGTRRRTSPSRSGSRAARSWPAPTRWRGSSSRSWPRCPRWRASPPACTPRRPTSAWTSPIRCRPRGSPWPSRSRWRRTATSSAAARCGCTATGRRSTAGAGRRPATPSACWVTTTSRCAPSPTTWGSGCGASPASGRWTPTPAAAGSSTTAPPRSWSASTARAWRCTR